MLCMQSYSATRVVMDLAEPAAVTGALPAGNSHCSCPIMAGTLSPASSPAAKGAGPHADDGVACRVIRRLAAPLAMTHALPKGTVHYGCTVVGATVTSTGRHLLLVLQQHYL